MITFLFKACKGKLSPVIEFIVLVSLVFAFSNGSTIPEPDYYTDSELDESNYYDDTSEDLYSQEEYYYEGRIWGNGPGANLYNKRDERTERIRYLLNLRNDEGELYHALARNGSDAEVNFVPNATLKVLIHGYTPNAEETAEDRISRSKLFDLADEYMKSGRPDLNVIVVDWTELSSYPIFEYLKAAGLAKDAGEDVAEFLIRLKNKGIITLDKVHIIGFSLGAHVAGTAGNLIYKETGSKVSRITGLDPAGPGFEPLYKIDRSRVVDETDAEYVDIIHCNEGTGWTLKRGSIVQAGHSDFYPNGGSSQPECGYFATESCHHHMCPIYYLRSVNSRSYPSCSCDSWENYKYGGCDCQGDNLVNMGEHLNVTKARGKYFLSF